MTNRTLTLTAAALGVALAAPVNAGAPVALDEMIPIGPNTELDFSHLISRPNILLVIMDDIGADKVASYEGDFAAEGYSPSFMPVTDTLDSLGDAGLRFTNAWANPVCSPTRAATYTGRHGFRTGVGSALGASGSSALDPASEVSLAEVLHGDPDGDGTRENLWVNYDSGLFGKWHLGDNGLVDEAVLSAGTMSLLAPFQEHPIDHGYDYFAGEMDGSVTSYWDWVRVVSQPGWTRASRETTFATEQEVDDALGWIGSQSGAWFVTMAFQAPHSLQDPVSGGFGYFETPGSTTLSCFSGWSGAMSDQEKYQQTVECLDLYIEDLLLGLDTMGELDDTLVIVVGDNGTEGTFEEDIFDGDGRAKGSVFQDGVHVPFIVADGGAWKDYIDTGALNDGLVADPGRDVDHLVHVVDLFATITDVAGVSQSTGDDSVSFADVLDDPTATSARSYVYAETFSGNNGSATLRGARYKLNATKASDGAGGFCRDLELYDMNGVMREGSDVSTSRSMILSALEAELDALHATATSTTWLPTSNCP